MKSDTQVESYQFWVRAAAIAATSTALLLVVLKVYAWAVSDASAMLASATDSLLDLFASLTNVIILRFALMPADDEHRFGHGKAESLAGLAQSAFVMGSAILLILNGANRIANPIVIEKTEVGIWVSIIAIVMTLALVVFQKIVIKKTNSLAIGADSLHYQSDLLLNLGVLLSLFLSQGLWLYADGVFTVLVGAYLMVGATKILWFSVEHLMDKELSGEEETYIKYVVQQTPKALGVHEIRTRQAGQIKFFQFHLELDDKLSLLEAHQIGLAIETKVRQRFSPCEVLIHHDPQSVAQQELATNEKE